MLRIVFLAFHNINNSSTLTPPSPHHNADNINITATSTTTPLHHRHHITMLTTPTSLPHQQQHPYTTVTTSQCWQHQHHCHKIVRCQSLVVSAVVLSRIRRLGRLAVVGGTVLADEAKFGWTGRVIPRVVVFWHKIETRLIPAEIIRLSRLMPMLVGHRTVFDTSTSVQFPHKLGLGVRVNALPGRPQIGTIRVTTVIMVALRRHFSCK